QATLRRALIDLVHERDLSQITVADVADRADVSRSTFYDHYQDVHELAEAACTSMLDDMFGYVLALDTARPHSSDFQEDPDPALTGFFAHFAEHAGLYRSLLGPTGSARVIEHVRRRTTAAAHYSGRLAPAADPPPAPPPRPPTPRRRSPLARPTSRSMCRQRSSPAHCSAWPPTGCSADARERPSR